MDIKAEFDSRIKFLRLDETALRNLKEAWSLIEPEIVDILNAFYEHLFRFPETSAIIGDRRRIKNLTESQKNPLEADLHQSVGRSVLRQGPGGRSCPPQDRPRAALVYGRLLLRSRPSRTRRQWAQSLPCQTGGRTDHRHSEGRVSRHGSRPFRLQRPRSRRPRAWKPETGRTDRGVRQRRFGIDRAGHRRGRKYGKCGPCHGGDGGRYHGKGRNRRRGRRGDDGIGRDGRGRDGGTVEIGGRDQPTGFALGADRRRSGPGGRTCIADGQRPR